MVASAPPAPALKYSGKNVTNFPCRAYCLRGREPVRVPDATIWPTPLHAPTSFGPADRCTAAEYERLAVASRRRRITNSSEPLL
jgi:hypothetical protein